LSINSFTYPVCQPEQYERERGRGWGGKERERERDRKRETLQVAAVWQRDELRKKAT
jgi:hypothetical protein